MLKWIILLLMGLVASFASLCLKKSTQSGLNPRKLLMSVYFYLGGFLYVAAALMNLYLLKKLPYSVVVPLSSLTYIWTLIVSHYFLEERITVKKITGICFILAGVTFLVLF